MRNGNATDVAHREADENGNLRHESLTANVRVNPFGNEDQESREGRQDAEFDE
jgi:hypothetical protein